jgi:hypothetical protein
MKQFILLTVISLALASPGVRAKAPVVQQSPPGWFIVFEEKFASSNRAHFMKAQKEAVDLWKIYNPDVSVFAWQNDDNTLYRVIPILSFASIDTLYRKMEQVSEVMKAGSTGGEGRPVSLSTVSGSVMVWVPELSHHPDADFSAYSDKPYTEWMFAYLHSGQEREAEQALQRFRDYYIDKKLDYPWDTFRVVFGNNTPVLIGLFCAESPAALQAKGKRIWDKHGTELEKLWNDVVRHTWKIENKPGWFNPSLSNIPVVSPEEIVESER